MTIKLIILDGWAKSGARPKKPKRNRKKQTSQSQLIDTVQQDRHKNEFEQNFTHTYSTSPAKEFAGGFKQPSSPKKRVVNPSNGNSQKRFPSHSPHAKRSDSGPRNNQNRSPSPAKQMQRKHPTPLEGRMYLHKGETPKQHTSVQQEFNAIREAFQRPPLQNYQFQGNRPHTDIFSVSRTEDQRPNKQQQMQQFTKQQPQQTRMNRNLRYIIIDGSNIAMAYVLIYLYLQ